MRGTHFAELTAFVAVAEHASFTNAGRHLGLRLRRLARPYVRWKLVSASGC